MTENEASAAVTDIVARYSSRLFYYIRNRVESREDAEDILQEVFYQLSRSLGDGA